MPFDATPELPIETRIIDKALEILCPNGEHWTQGRFHDNGTYCMRGAIHSARRRLRLMGDRTEQFITAQLHGNEWIEDFNDAPHRTFIDIRNLLEVVREEILIRRFQFALAL